MKLQKIQEYASFLITTVVALILAMMMFVVIKGSDNWKSPQLWLDAGFNTLLQIVMIATWLPEGKKRGELNEVFMTNRKTANELMTSASGNDKFDYLVVFCAAMTDKNRQAWISKRVARFGIVYNQWGNEAYRVQFDKKTNDKVARIERKAMYKVNEIKATEIVTNSQISLIYDTKDHTNSLTTWNIIGKMLMSVFMCAVGAFLAPEGVAFTIAALLNFFYWLLIMSLSIFYSIRTGYKLIATEKNDYYKRLIIFLKNFDAWFDKNHNTNCL